MDGICEECGYKTITKYRLLGSKEYETPGCCAPYGVYYMCMRIKRKYSTQPVTIHDTWIKNERIAFWKEKKEK